MIFIFICFTFLNGVFTQNDYKTYKGYKMYNIEGVKQGVQNFVKIMTENYEIPYHTVKELNAEMLVAPELLSIVERLVEDEKLQRKISIEDYSEIIREEQSYQRRNGFSWKAYYDVDDIYTFVFQQNEAYPNWTQVVVGGQSYEGRQIIGLRINTPITKQGKPVMFIESGIHAREWITPAAITYFMNELLTSSDPEIQELRDQFDWHIFPTVNPDGYQYSFTVDRMWRKTRSNSSNGCRGADPNRNWDYNWMKHGASSNPCDYQVYGGSKPFSEVETRTLSQYIAGLENLAGYVAFHSDAQALLLPYSDALEHADNYEDLEQIGRTSLRYGYAVNQAKYGGPGTAAEILYKVSGGSMDWVRHTLGTPIVYTYELRGVHFHWPPSRIYQQGDEVTQMMLGLAHEARNLGYY